ncbi:hypothetical protein OSG_eHP32_00225 [environmental Halophage eHP-32]|nr:hypothetical protein OSG_eHP32_00225 [environmental Halophage eHP-32]
MPELPDQFVLQRRSDANCYHTSHCIAVKRTSPEEATAVSDRTINWHDWDECQYCTNEAPTAVVDDD